MRIPLLDDFILNNRRLMRFLVPVFCMWINFVSFSYIRGSGVLYMEFRKSYGASIAQASWTFTLATSLLGMLKDHTIVYNTMQKLFGLFENQKSFIGHLEGSDWPIVRRIITPK